MRLKTRIITTNAESPVTIPMLLSLYVICCFISVNIIVMPYLNILRPFRESAFMPVCLCMHVSQRGIRSYMHACEYV